MSELPEGWTPTQLGVLLRSIVGGGTPTKSNQAYFQGSIPFMTVKDLHARFVADTQDHITREALEDSASTLIPADTLIVATRMSLGKITRPLVPTAINQDLKALFLHDGIDKTYVEYLWRANEAHIQNMGTGTTVKGIRLEDIRGLEVPLAPSAEQARIANQLDTLLTRIQFCNDRFDAIPALLTRFRQAVLDTATTGVLTGEWREKQCLDDGTAMNELTELERSKRGSLKVRGNSANVASELLFDIPPSWAWVANHRLAQDDGNAICAGPFGTIFKAKDFRPSGVPIIFLRHVGNSRFLTHKPGFMDEQIWAEFHQPYSVFGGELLVTKLGDPPGTACMYPAENGKAMVTPDVMKMSVNAEAAETKYLMHFFNSTNAKKIVAALCFGVTRLRIDLSMFKTFPIPLPPREEQAEIVRRVEALFALADRIEARCTAARARTQRLSPLVLAKAFRGELVPQEPQDESAIALLERIASQRTLQAAKNESKNPRQVRATRSPKEAAAMTKSRQDEDVKDKPYLADHLRRLGSPTTAELLFKASELPIADFYKQLAWEVAQGHIADAGATLEARHAAR